MIVPAVTCVSSTLRGFCAFGGDFLYCGNPILILSIGIIIGANIKKCKVF